MKYLSVIIPYRNRLDNLVTLAKNIALVDKTLIEFLVISLGDDSAAARAHCAAAGMYFHCVEYTGIFKIGMAHNIGASLACGQYIMKYDVDLLPYEGLFSRLLQEMKTIFSTAQDYFVLGCFFAAQSFSERELNGIVTKHHLEMLTDEKNRERRQFTEPEGTMFVIDRNVFLSFGGCNESFSGHGWEDYQVIYFAERNCNPALSFVNTLPSTFRSKLVHPKNAEMNKVGLILIHKWHRPVNDPGYYAQKKANAELLGRLVREAQSKY